jgi:hypothetical protein
MNNPLISIDREWLKRQQIADSITIDPEGFRAEATKTYAEYLPVERAIIDGLGSNAYDIIVAWGEKVRPSLRLLRDKLSEAAFKDGVTKDLILEEDEIQVKINEIIEKRELEIMDNFIRKLYPTKNNIHNKPERTKNFLSRPESEIELIKSHYVNYSLYKEAADKNNITVVDPHTSFFKRISAKKHIRRERNDTLIFENNRLLYIDDRLKSISAMDGGLLVDIYDKNWDLITVLDLRNNYEKKLIKLSKEDDKNAIKRLAIFDTVTLEFKKCQAEKMIVDADQCSLEVARIITKDIDRLLLRIFDLSNIQKNRLLVYAKEYRELNQEKAAILDRRNNRQNYL